MSAAVNEGFDFSSFSYKQGTDSFGAIDFMGG